MRSHPATGLESLQTPTELSVPALAPCPKVGATIVPQAAPKASGIRRTSPGAGKAQGHAHRCPLKEATKAASSPNIGRLAAAENRSLTDKLAAKRAQAAADLGIPPSVPVVPIDDDDDDDDLQEPVLATEKSGNHLGTLE